MAASSVQTSKNRKIAFIQTNADSNKISVSFVNNIRIIVQIFEIIIVYLLSKTYIQK